MFQNNSLFSQILLAWVIEAVVAKLGLQHIVSPKSSPIYVKQAVKFVNFSVKVTIHIVHTVNAFAFFLCKNQSFRLILIFNKFSTLLCSKFILSKNLFLKLENAIVQFCQMSKLQEQHIAEHWLSCTIAKSLFFAMIRYCKIEIECLLFQSYCTLYV